MGCSSSQSTAALDDTKTKAIKTEKEKQFKMEYPASEAFTIPLDDAANAPDQLNDTLRQPPKRLQQLMQQAAETEPITLLELEDKQQKAEQRRQELMQQKIESIQKNTQLLMRGHDDQFHEKDNEDEQSITAKQPQSIQDEL